MIFLKVSFSWLYFRHVFCSRHYFRPCTSGPYLWLLLQRLLLGMILLVLMADQSQPLTWVMVMLSTVLSSAVLPWWQKERVPACQRKGSAESWRVTESLTSLPVWLTALPFIDMETHTHEYNDRRTMKEAVGFHVVVESFSPRSLFSVSLKILLFYSSVASHTSGDHIQIPDAVIQGCFGSCMSQCCRPNLHPHISR